MDLIKFLFVLFLPYQASLLNSIMVSSHSHCTLLEISGELFYCRTLLVSWSCSPSPLCAGAGHWCCPTTFASKQGLNFVYKDHLPYWRFHVHFVSRLFDYQLNNYLVEKVLRIWTFYSCPTVLLSYPVFLYFKFFVKTAKESKTYLKLCRHEKVVSGTECFKHNIFKRKKQGKS